MSTTSPNPTHLTAHGLTPGDQLSKYRVVELIGQGGVSMVWKGHDPLIDRTVAIKHLTVDGFSASDQEALREAFRTEAALLKQLGSSHPHLVQTLDFIDEPRGLFIVMEFIDGPSLEHVLAANPGPMDQRQALGILAATALVLDHLHQRQVVHRDLKPANILLPRAGGLKVCDFGLATILSDQDAMGLGTVRYMAPECFAAAKADGRADLYSLGLIAYEMLAGRAAFEDAFKLILRDQRNQAMRWMKWHTNPRAAVPPLHQLNPQVPVPLSELVGRMVEKDPLQRVGSAGELVAAIRRQFAGGADAVRAGAGVAATPTGSAHKTAAIPRRSKVPLILAAVLLVQAALAGGMWTIRERQRAAKAHLARQSVRDEFAAARKAFDAGDWAAAKTAFTPLLADAEFAKLAEAATLWCDANLLFNAQAPRPLTERDYAPVLELCDQLRGRVEMDKRQDDIRRLSDKASRAQAALGVIKDIRKVMAQGQFNAARQRIEESRRTMALIDEERAELDRMYTSIDVSEHGAYFARAEQEARDLIQAGRRKEAVQRLELAMRDRGEHPRLRELREQVMREDGITATQTQARDAEARGNLPEAIRLYTRVDEMRGTEEFKDKVRLLKGDIAAAEGERAEQKGDLTTATRKYLESLGFNPANALALAGQGRIKDRISRDSHEVAGDTALAAGEYESAIQHWQRAQDLDPRPATSDKMRKARERIEIGKGVALARQGKKEEALRQLQPYDKDPEAARWIENINVLVQFESFRERGDQAYQGGDYPEAQRWYRKAEGVKGIAEDQQRAITQRKDDAEYADLMVKARRDNQADNLVQAEAWAVAAQRIRNTDEVKKLLASVQEKRAKKEQAPEE